MNCTIQEFQGPQHGHKESSWAKWVLTLSPMPRLPTELCRIAPKAFSMQPTNIRTYLSLEGFLRKSEEYLIGHSRVKHLLRKLLGQSPMAIDAE